MTEHNRPALERTIPTAADPVTPATVAIFAILATGLVLLRTHAEHIAPVLFVAIAYLVSPAADWLEGKRRMACTTVAAGLALIGAILTWELMGLWLLIPAPLIWWVPFAIGRGRGSKRSQANKIKHGLALVNEGLKPIVRDVAPPGTKIRDAKLGRNNTAVVASGHLPASAPKGSAPIPKDAANGLATKVANPAGMTTTELSIVDLSATKAAGEFELALSLARPFNYDTLPMPPREQWPDGSFPLGTDAYGAPIYVAIKTLDHVLVSGRTRWGKSNTLWVLLIGLARATEGAVEFHMIDPKGGAELGAWRNLCADFARTPQEGRQLLARLVGIMDARYAAMERQGQRKSDLWPIVCIIDEAAQVLDDKQARAHSLKLAQMALAANIHIVYATQYPTDDLFGSALKQNISTVITHRLKDSVGSNVAMGAGAKGDGWDASKLEKPGRAIVEMPHLVEARMKVQVYLAPDEVPDDLSAMVSGPSGHPTGGDAHAGQTAPDTPRTDTPRTDTPDSQTPKYDDRIAELLDIRPLSARAVAEAVGCSPDTAAKALKRLAEQGRAKPTKAGWIDPVFAEDAA